MTILPGRDLFDVSIAMHRALPDKRDGLAIVLYHTDTKQDDTFKGLRGGDLDYMPVIAYAVQQARTFHPEATIIMLTDRETHFPDWMPPMQIIRLPVNGVWVGYERCRAQAAFAQVWQGRVIHMDSDIEIRRRFDDIFERSFDFAVTWRAPTKPVYKEMPINGGMLLQKNPGATASFMTTVVDLVGVLATMNNQPKLLTAYGEQMALAALVTGRGVGTYPTWWGNLAILDCKEVNCTPDGSEMWNPGEGPYALHPKGPRKIGMFAVA